jgi:hypothetical protein
VSSAHIGSAYSPPPSPGQFASCIVQNLRLWYLAGLYIYHSVMLWCIHGAHQIAGRWSNSSLSTSIKPVTSRHQIGLVDSLASQPHYLRRLLTVQHGPTRSGNIITLIMPISHLQAQNFWPLIPSQSTRHLEFPNSSKLICSINPSHLALKGQSVFQTSILSNLALALPSRVYQWRWLQHDCWLWRLD